MTAAVIATKTVIGVALDNAPSTTGTGLIWGVYNATSTENDDWVVLSEFAEIKHIACYAIATGALAKEACTIDATTTNKLVFTAGGTDAIRVFVMGTPA